MQGRSELQRLAGGGEESELLGQAAGLLPWSRAELSRPPPVAGGVGRQIPGASTQHPLQTSPNPYPRLPGILAVGRLPCLAPLNSRGGYKAAPLPAGGHDSLGLGPP